MKKSMLAGIASVLIVFALNLTLKSDTDASFLVVLLVFNAFAQGIIALAAAAQISEGNWLSPIGNKLLSMWWLQLLTPFLFVAHAMNLAPYPWTEHPPNAWMTEGLFVARNVGVLLLTAGLAWLLRRSTLKKSSNTTRIAIFYALAFVLSQTLVAMDWLMSFEYPWLSTMFAPLQFVEALFLSTGLAAVIASVFVQKGDKRFLPTQVDAATLFLGFSLFWGGLFYAQFLTIWYGNIPEEVAPLARRAMVSPMRELGILSIVTMFPIPFIGLIPATPKRTPAAVRLFFALAVFGFVLQKIVILMPVATLNPIILIVSGLALTTTLVLAVGDALAVESPMPNPQEHH